MEHEGCGPGRHQQEHGLPPVPLAVDEHQAHVFEVAQGSGEELHERVGQAVAGQHFHGISFNRRYAPVEGLEDKWKRVMSRRHVSVTMTMTSTRVIFHRGFCILASAVLHHHIAFPHSFYLASKGVFQGNVALKEETSKLLDFPRL